MIKKCINCKYFNGLTGCCLYFYSVLTLESIPSDRVCDAYTSKNHYMSRKTNWVPQIYKVIFNDPATIVFWMDGTKTVVKTQDGEIFDPEKGLAMAISKKFFGNKGNYYNEFKKWLSEEEEGVI